MLEESFKAIEGPVARRKTEARHAWPDGTVYQPFNFAGEIAKRAAPEVLYTDALGCEGAMKYHREFCSTPTDYAKILQCYTNRVLRSCGGMHGSPCRSHRHHRGGILWSFYRHRNQMGVYFLIVPNKGFVQGSVSGPEQAKPAQSLILSIRAVIKAFYTTFRGRKVHAAGFADDTEHY